MDSASISDWVERYRRAWNSNDPVEIGALFSDDALYYTGPFDAPWSGRDTIVREWLARQDAPGSTAFRYEVLAAAPETGVIRGWTQYHDPAQTFSNIWLVRFDPAGRCREFTEWWVARRPA
jgi:uncharacterized protein (TIGR02246 family)